MVTNPMFFMFSLCEKKSFICLKGNKIKKVKKVKKGKKGKKKGNKNNTPSPCFWDGRILIWSLPATPLSLSRNLEGHLDLTWRLSRAINAAYITSENLEKQGDSSSADFARTLSVEKLLTMKL